MKSNRKLYVLYALIVAVLGQIYICPSPDSVFVVSAGVICLELVLLHGTNFHPFAFTVLTGALTAVLRALLVLSSGGNAVQSLYSTFTFYFVFAMLVQASRLMQLPQSKTLCKIAVMCCFDAVSNVAELLLLRQLSVSGIQLILLTALVRAVLVWVMHVFYSRQTLYIVQEEHQKRYARLNQLAASIHSEVFYLSRTADDLEALVRDGYAMYESAEDPQVSQAVLALSNRTHEIQKDCDRVISGLQTLTDEIEHEHTLHLHDIFRILQDSTVRRQEMTDKNISISFSCAGDAEIEHYFDIFTILNNLISNSVDACGTDGHIDVRAAVSEDTLTLTVSDDGSGIEDDLLPLLFRPGFSTKFDPQTGKASDGIGLCHVKNAVDRTGGTIEVASGETTVFTVRLPLAHSWEKGVVTHG
ncbi:sensor histidine kinase [Butyricicoccus sp.]|uniref:sensor histidine kinase n=1 Tax=Butyricicoccus sp. TaxID=2049021 RepID=UPI0037364DC0